MPPTPSESQPLPQGGSRVLCEPMIHVYCAFWRAAVAHFKVYCVSGVLAWGTCNLWCGPNADNVRCLRVLSSVKHGKRKQTNGPLAKTVHVPRIPPAKNRGPQIVCVCHFGQQVITTDNAVSLYLEHPRSESGPSGHPRNAINMQIRPSRGSKTTINSLHTRGDPSAHGPHPVAAPRSHIHPPIPSHPALLAACARAPNHKHPRSTMDLRTSSAPPPTSARGGRS